MIKQLSLFAGFELFSLDFSVSSHGLICEEENLKGSFKSQSSSVSVRLSSLLLVGVQSGKILFFIYKYH